MTRIRVIVTHRAQSIAERAPGHRRRWGKLAGSTYARPAAKIVQVAVDEKVIMAFGTVNVKVPN
jgi:hypothetical protein